MDNRESTLLRSNGFLYFLVLLFLLLSFRLFNLQVLSHSYYKKQASSQQFHKIRHPACRGDILSSNGKLLARSLEVHSLYAIPKDIENKDKFLKQISSLLSLSPSFRSKLAERIQMKRYKNFLWIARHLSAEEYGKIKRKIAKKKLTGVAFEKEYLRYYPNGHLLSHVLGFSNVDGKGLEGLEMKFNPMLQGKDGYQVVGVDALGRRLQENPKEEVSPQDGATMVLTIDSVIQHYMERELDEVMARWTPKAVCAVVIDVTNGKVLALSNRPNYNLNNPQEADIEARRNRVITDYYEPGSTIKVFTAMAAVKEGAVKWDDTFFCHHGRFRFGPRVITDTHGYGDLSVRTIVVKSSNIGMAQVGVKLGPEKVRQNIIDFDFGKKTGIELPGEEKGKVTSKKRWSFYSTTSVSMGYEIGVTALQLARGYSALVNGGYLYKPTLIEKISVQGKVLQSFKPQLVRRIYDNPKLQKEILSVLQGVVEEGTAKSAQIADYTLGGKTGTARRNAQGKRGYTSQYLASFVGVAPISNPRLLVVVMTDSPKGAMYGGTVSAPAAARILQSSLSYLGVPPDKKPEGMHSHVLPQDPGRRGR